jgi:hypothetical protein
MLTDRRLQTRAFSLHAALLALSVAVCSLCSTTLAAQALGTAFTYQGELTAAGVPANASYDMEFRAFDALTDGAQIGPTVMRPAVPVSQGLFSVALDFGAGQFAGDRQWLEIRIRPAGSGSYETLLPRTEITAAPYALGAAVALADSVSTTSIVDGTIGAADIDSTQVQRRVTGQCATNEYMRGVDANGAVNCVAGSLGTVTRINAGAGLTGGPITLQGTLSIADGGVTSLMIANGTVANVDLAPNAVNAGNIVDGSVGLADINTAQVQARIGGSCAVGQYVRAIAADGTVTCGSDATGTPGWALGGNAGTDPASQFLGTTDAQPLVIRTQNVRSLRIEPSTVLVSGNPITANMIAGSSGNSVTAGVRGATIAGGGTQGTAGDPDFFAIGPNVVTDHYSVVSGGFENRAGDALGTLADAGFATVSGGRNNRASDEASTVGGGSSNDAFGRYATVGGGLSNSATEEATVAGGGGNRASGNGSAIGGGSGNDANGDDSVVPGGSDNCAGGDYSFAGGRRAKVRSATDRLFGGCTGLPSYPGGTGDQGTFAWADSQAADFVSTGPDQFLIRAGGGLFLNTNQTVFAPDDVVLKARPVGGDADMDLRLVTRTNRSVNLFVSDASGTLNVAVPDLASGANRLTVSGGSGGSAFLSNGGTWTNASSRSFKEGLAAIDPLSVLERLVALPISTWRYIGSEEGVHLGPMAEDFKAAFGLAGDGTSIATVDADGVALAAIQGLNRKLEAERDALRAENAALKARMDRIERLLDARH